MLNTQNKRKANEYVLQEIQIVNEQERENAMENLESDRIYPNKEKEYMLRAFKEFYKEIKNEMEIDKAFEELPLENLTSNQAFKQLNPETSFTLFDVMTDEKRFEEFKTWIKQRIKSSESFTGLIQSALKFTETKSSARSHNQAQPHRRIKSSAVQLEKSPTQVDCAR